MVKRNQSHYFSATPHM